MLSALLLTALTIAAALLTRVEASLRIFGSPGFAMFLFLAAAAGAVILLFDVIRHDRDAIRPEEG